MAKLKQPLNTDIQFRADGFKASTVNGEARTVEAVMSTETPVMMPDWERMEMVPEVLLTKGAEYPAQIPLLNAHNRHDSKMQIGSVRSISKGNGQITGTLHYASSAQDEWTLVREGHSTDVSVGYRVLARTFVPRGTTQNIQGRDFTGPVNVVTKWRIQELSQVPIGADEQAKLRGFDPQTLPFDKETFVMEKELREALVARGMPTEHTDEQAQKWLLENGLREAAKPAPKAEEKPDLRIFDEKRLADILEEREKAREAKQAAFRAEIDAACQLADCEHLRAECYLLADIGKVRERLQAEKSKRATSLGFGPITFGPAAEDTQRKAMASALMERALRSATTNTKLIEEVFPAKERSEHTQFRHASLLDLAKECLILDGYDLRGKTREEIAIAALGWGNKVGMRSQRDAAYHTTGSFTKLTQDAVNKSMQVGYMEFPSTWDKVFRVGEDAQDFKTIHRMRMGAIPNLPDWPDNTEPDEASLADAEETYKVQPKSLKLSLSYQLLVNDDMSVIGRFPAMFGNAASRTVNAKAWEQITSNPTMSDGVALFAAATGARKRTNLTTGAGAPSVTAVQTLTNLMMQMRGENTPEGNESADILALQPRFIAGGSALSTTIKQLVLSVNDPAAMNSITYNPTSELVPVIEPLLDAASTTAWYLFASTSQIDTVEVTFLAGHRSPVTRQWMDEETLSQNWAVLQAFAAKALNHRGMQKHAGA